MRHRIVLLIAVASLVTGLEGCASYRAVSEFADQTTKMTTVVKGEFVQLDTLCAQQAELVIVVNNLADDAPLDQCARYKRTQARFASLTVDVLDGYAEALSDLADDRPFDLSPEMRSAAAKVRGLKDSGGNTMVNDPSVLALTRVADLLADALAAVKREEAVRRLAAATPDLAVMGRSLRSFFVRAPDAPPGTPQSPYVNLVAVMTSSSDSTQRVLSSTPMRKAEPIRTAELSRELRARQKLLAKRGADGAVPVSVAAVIDAWIDALDRFSTDAFKHDSREMIDRMKTLRGTMRAAREAIADN